MMKSSIKFLLLILAFSVLEASPAWSQSSILDEKANLLPTVQISSGYFRQFLADDFVLSMIAFEPTSQDMLLTKMSISLSDLKARHERFLKVFGEFSIYQDFKIQTQTIFKVADLSQKQNIREFRKILSQTSNADFRNVLQNIWDQTADLLFQVQSNRADPSYIFKKEDFWAKSFGVEPSMMPLSRAATALTVESLGFGVVEVLSVLTLGVNGVATVAVIDVLFSAAQEGDFYLKNKTFSNTNFSDRLGLNLIFMLPQAAGFKVLYGLSPLLALGSGTALMTYQAIEHSQNKEYLQTGLSLALAVGGVYQIGETLKTPEVTPKVVDSRASQIPKTPDTFEELSRRWDNTAAPSERSSIFPARFEVPDPLKDFYAQFSPQSQSSPSQPNGTMALLEKPQVKVEIETQLGHVETLPELEILRFAQDDSFVKNDLSQSSLTSLFPPTHDGFRVEEPLQPKDNGKKRVLIIRRLNNQITGIFIKSLTEEEIAQLASQPQYYEIYSFGGSTPQAQGVQSSGGESGSISASSGSAKEPDPLDKIDIHHIQSIHDLFPPEVKSLERPLRVVSLGTGILPVWEKVLEEKFGVRVTGIEIERNRFGSPRINTQLQGGMFFQTDYETYTPDSLFDVLILNYPNPGSLSDAGALFLVRSGIVSSYQLLEQWLEKKAALIRKYVRPNGIAVVLTEQTDMNAHIDPAAIFSKTFGKDNVHVYPNIADYVSLGLTNEEILKRSPYLGSNIKYEMLNSWLQGHFYIIRNANPNEKPKENILAQFASAQITKELTKYFQLSEDGQWIILPFSGIRIHKDHFQEFIAHPDLPTMVEHLEDLPFMKVVILEAPVHFGKKDKGPLSALMTLHSDPQYPELLDRFFPRGYGSKVNAVYMYDGRLAREAKETGADLPYHQIAIMSDSSRESVAHEFTHYLQTLPGTPSSTNENKEKFWKTRNETAKIEADVHLLMALFDMKHLGSNLGDVLDNISSTIHYLQDSPYPREDKKIMDTVNNLKHFLVYLKIKYRDLVVSEDSYFNALNILISGSSPIINKALHQKITSSNRVEILEGIKELRDHTDNPHVVVLLTRFFEAQNYDDIRFEVIEFMGRVGTRQAFEVLRQFYFEEPLSELRAAYMRAFRAILKKNEDIDPELENEVRHFINDISH